MNSSDARFAFRSPFYFDLTDLQDNLISEEFDRIKAEVEKWSAERGIPYEIERTKKGFRVTLSHPIQLGDAFGMSLYIHLSVGIFREMEAEHREIQIK